MKKRFGLSKLRFKKFRELVRTKYGMWSTLNNRDEIRYGKTMFDYIFRPKFIPCLEFCINDLSVTYKVSIKASYTIDNIIDIAYSNFILGEYNMSDRGADFKFNTIRNVFKYYFKSREYMINHYSHKLSLPVIQLLKKEFTDIDVLNIVMPARISLMTVVKEFENGIFDHVRKEFNLMRAGPVNIRSPLTLVA